MEHVRAIQHGGDDSLANLALACQRCNAYRGPNPTGIDPKTDEVELLFHPRTDSRKEYFRFEGPMIVGLTSKGRTTVRVLNMNEQRRLLLRQRLIANNEFP
ncbi:MAG: restriction endonuclease [Planctomycetaceae bacterium]|nr:restriction endonuclease [Planctomycetaceae bacterium]